MNSLLERLTRRFPVSHGLVAAVLGAACLAGMPGCVIYVSDDGGWYSSGASEEETRKSTLEHVAGSALDVKTDNGSVTIEAADRKDVEVTAKIKARTKERLDAVKVLAERRDDKSLAVHVKWPEGGRKSDEGCSLEIKVPDAGGAKVRTSNGAVKVAGVSGKGDIDTSNGSVKAVRHVGELTIKSSNGSITVEDSTGPVDVDTSNGSVTVSLRPDGPGPVKIDTSNSSVTLTVGKAFAGTLSAKTSNGSITLPPEGAAKVSSKTKGKATVVFGEGGRSSSITTSNGSVTVRVAD